MTPAEPPTQRSVRLFAGPLLSFNARRGGSLRFDDLGTAPGILGQVFGDLREAAVVIDADHRVVFINPAGSRLFDYPAAELRGRSLRDVCAGEAAFEEAAPPPCAPEDRGSSGRAVVRYRRRDGTKFDGETFGGPIRDPRGNAIGHLAIIQDVTRQRSTERALTQLHRITSDRRPSGEERLDALLKLGTQHFGLPIGILGEVIDQRYVVARAVAPDDALPPGTEFPLNETYCEHTLRADGPVGVHHVARSALREHPYYEKSRLEAYLGAPVIVDGERYGTLSFSSSAPTTPFTEQDHALIKLCATWVGNDIAHRRDLRALEEAKSELEHYAATDDLTRLSNRRAISEILEAETMRARRYGDPVSVVLANIDHFKQVNDTHGHECGDRVLRMFGKLCRGLHREVDAAGRWSGEEFLIVLRNTHAAGAKRFAERLRSSVEALSVPHNGEELHVTVSLGVAAWQPGTDATMLVKRADRALYCAKTNGRNCVIVAD